MAGYELPEDCCEIERDEEAHAVFDYIMDHEGDAGRYDGVPGSEVVHEVDIEPAATYTALRKLVSSGVVTVEFEDAAEYDGGWRELDDADELEQDGVEPMYRVADVMSVGDVVNGFLKQ